MTTHNPPIPDPLAGARLSPAQYDEVQRLRRVEAAAYRVVRFGPLSVEAKRALDEIRRLCPVLGPSNEKGRSHADAL